MNVLASGVLGIVASQPGKGFVHDEFKPEGYTTTKLYSKKEGSATVQVGA